MLGLCGGNMRGWHSGGPSGLRSRPWLLLVAIVGVVSLLSLALVRPEIGFTIYFP
jgi:hypothetical protein